MSSRTMRWSARVGVAALAVAVAAPAAWAATSWTNPNAAKAANAASAAGSWNYGSSLGKLTNGNIALAYTGAKPKPQGAYVRVGTVAANKSVTLGAAVRVSQATKFADRTSLAAGGNNIYAAWITQHKASITDNTKPRVAYISTGNSAGTFGAPVRLNAANGRVDYPITAAKGNNVYVTYTNSDTGDVLVRTSTNAAATFPAAKTRTLGTTTRNDGEGLAAWPIDCASPNSNNVGVVWLPGDGTINLSVSKNNGGMYTNVSIPAVNAGGNDSGWATCDAVGSRIGITWNEDDGVYYAEYSTATNSFTTPRKNVYSLPGGGYGASYSGTVALTGAGTVGIAAPLCVPDGCDYSLQTTQIDLKWLESSDNGAAFGAAEAVANGTVAGKFLNDSPTALFYDSTTRFVLYNGWDADYTNYRLYLSTGKS